MASDTLAYNTVAWLFPQSWVKVLSDFRSKQAVVGKGSDRFVVNYAKFSSMGNGATFTIETLVFAAACRAVGSKAYSVYGDDIIIEADLYAKLVRLLKFFGFSTNADKSFHTGPFRESCGSNWYLGTDITPKYIRDLDRRKAVKCHLINSLMEIAEYEGEMWKYLLKLTLEWELPLSPFNENTMSGVWIHPHFAYREKMIRTRHQIAFFKGYVPQGKSYLVADIRSLFLWHLMAQLDRTGCYRFINQKVSDPVQPVLSSRYTSSSHKYVRKWVHWRIPVAGAPENLFGFSEHLFRRKTE
jgi:hypothetical protein